MIDTDKYEGHTPAPWDYSPDCECIFGPLDEELDHYPILVNFPPTLYGVTTGEEYNNHPEVLKHRKVTKDGKVYHTKSFWWGDSLSALDATHKLMADAPLLLAEVKRLRESVAYAASLIQCRIEGDDLSSSGIRDYLLEAVGMTIEEAMATTDLNLWGDEE